ncbi:MAG: M20/M25/M40 family metallo-hydrolase [Isosphaeraceae bacterium]|nr:M20/M25/M40 family metallo-hydrolase [Isosphaeraceae bacterium]
MRRLLSLLLIVLAAAVIVPARAADYVSPAEARLKADVGYLADDAREGRGPGTKGLEMAADYIANAFKEAGLKPAPGADGYFQPFALRNHFQLAEGAKLAVEVADGKTYQATLRADFMPMATGGSAALKDVPVVFAGYGITAKDEKLRLDYDDYDGVDVQGKAVLIIRREPQQDKEDSPFGGKQTTDYAQFRRKLNNAAEHGAAAVLMVNDAFSLRGGGKDELLDLNLAQAGGKKVPFVMLSRAFADRLLAAADQPSLEELEKGIDQDLKPRSRPLPGVEVDLAYQVEPTVIKNVIGVLEGSGPLAEETIVVGAHYDHLGRGDLGSLAFGSREIHNGADDNASGTAMVLEMARRLARRPDPLSRRIVFMAFSGEERGLLGSAYYVEHPLYPLDKTVAMVNFDMVGRLNGKKELTIYGAGSSAGLEELVKALGASQGLKVNLVQGTGELFFSSDHASFYRKDIPVLFFFSGNHPDYHRPSDDTERINFPGMALIANIGELLLLDLATRPERPQFVRLSRGGFVGASRGGSTAYLGTIPNYSGGNEGVLLDGVNEGSPADKGGLKKGDIIIRFDGSPIDNVEDYMRAITKHKPGDTVEIVVKRDGKEVPLKVTLGSRPRRSGE